MSTSYTEILGIEGHALPHVVQAAARQMAEVSSSSATVRSHLAGLDGARWTGAAADAYHAKQHAELPGELDKLTESFGLAAEALRSYAGRLEAIVAEAQDLAQRKDASNTEVASASSKSWGTASQYQDAFLRRATTFDPTALPQADADLATAKSAHRTAVAEKNAAIQRRGHVEAAAESLRQDLESCAKRCSEDLRQASEKGINSNFLDDFNKHVIHGVTGQVAKELVHVVSTFIATGAEVTVDGVRYLLDDSEENRLALADSYSRFVEAAQPIMTAVGVGIMAGIAVALLFVPGGAAAVVPAMFAASKVLGAADVAVSYSKVKADQTLLKAGMRTDAQVQEDQRDFALAVVGMVFFGNASKAAIKTSLDDATHLGSKGFTEAQRRLHPEVVKKSERLHREIMIRTYHDGFMYKELQSITHDTLKSEALKGVDNLSEPLAGSSSTPAICGGASSQVRTHIPPSDVLVAR